MEPNFIEARRYITERMARELSPWLTYHSLRHTTEDVLPAADRLGKAANLSEQDQLLLNTAALFHDSGFLIAYHNHERHSMSLARAVLPQFGYSPQQIDTICDIIAATKMPQAPRSLLQELMCDADLDLLGRGDFLRRNDELLAEVRHYAGQPIRREHWLREQVKFLREHKFFTAAARSLRAEGKRRNAELLDAALASPGAWPAPSLNSPD